MKNKNVNQNWFYSIGNFLKQISIAIVSGFPSKKMYFKKERNTVVYQKQQNIVLDNEKHYHKPIAKPVVEKQTLLKEKKK